MQVLLKPLIALAALGFLASLTVHLSSLAGIANPFGDAAWALHGGVFVVWLPTVLLAQRLTKHATRLNFWKVILRGCPHWMRLGAYVLFPYALVNFFATLALSEKGDVNDLRLFSGHWMIFYYVGGAVLWSAENLWDEADRKCPQGHSAPPFANFCEQCGAKLPPTPR
jgi:hypothetical protein